MTLYARPVYVEEVSAAKDAAVKFVIPAKIAYQIAARFVVKMMKTARPQKNLKKPYARILGTVLKFLLVVIEAYYPRYP
jgi:hypothetical protein